VFEEATLEELAQDPLDHGAQGPMLPDEAGGPRSQQFLEKLLDQPQERRLARSVKERKASGGWSCSRARRRGDLRRANRDALLHREEGQAPP
jgi:hypothetical protein